MGVRQASDQGAPRVSVVVATRDRERRLSKLLVALGRQSLPAEEFEVVVVDDGSRDGTPRVLARAADEDGLALTSLRETGAGPARARNAGWRAARAALIAFTDDDCEPPPDWLAELVAGANANPGAIVQGPTTPIPRELGDRGAFTWTREIPGPNPWYATCNILYPRAVLAAVGGFDESFPDPLGEDTDLGWRARARGVPLVWRESALSHHAVDDLGAAGYLGTALLGVDAVAAFKRYPELRSEALRLGVIRNPALPRLALALAAFPLARKHPLAALLAVPYAIQLVRRCRTRNASLALAPYFGLYDLLAAWTSIRGSIRHRRLVL